MRSTATGRSRLEEGRNEKSGSFDVENDDVTRDQRRCEELHGSTERVAASSPVIV